MKLIYTISILIVLFILSCHSKSAAPFQIQIDSIAKHWVPDKRIGICDIKVIQGDGESLILKGESMFPEANAEVVKLFANSALSVVDSIVILPDTISSEKNWALVNLSVANIRSKPSHSSEMLTQAIMGTPMRVLKNLEVVCLAQVERPYQPNVFQKQQDLGSSDYESMD